MSMSIEQAMELWKQHATLRVNALIEKLKAVRQRDLVLENEKNVAYTAMVAGKEKATESGAERVAKSSKGYKAACDVELSAIQAYELACIEEKYYELLVHSLAGK